MIHGASLRLDMQLLQYLDAIRVRPVRQAARGSRVAFLDLPTYEYFPPVYYYQGRAREGMKTVAFAESYKEYLRIRAKAGEDPLLAEARGRSVARVKKLIADGQALSGRLTGGG